MRRRWRLVRGAREGRRGVADCERSQRRDGAIDRRRETACAGHSAANGRSRVDVTTTCRWRSTSMIRSVSASIGCWRRWRPIGFAQPDRAAIVVDLGTAITVDLVDSGRRVCRRGDSAGMAMSARALEEHTDALPRVAVDRWRKPPRRSARRRCRRSKRACTGARSARSASLSSNMSDGPRASPDVFISGGGSQLIADVLSRSQDRSVSPRAAPGAVRNRAGRTRLRLAARGSAHEHDNDQGCRADAAGRAAVAVVLVAGPARDAQL